MAATFNLLRGRDLIWNYVINNYLMGEEPAPFDLLHWNSDVTNLPAGWHRDYLETLYKQNRLVEKGGISVAGTPIDLTTIATPAYIQAGREDHIAPPAKRVEDHATSCAGPKRFVLAGSGHIAGVVNPPAAGKYQYWINDSDPAPASLDEFIAGATRDQGQLVARLARLAESADPNDGPRRPARGCRARASSKPIEDAPGRYVKTR